MKELYITHANTTFVCPYCGLKLDAAFYVASRYVFPMYFKCGKNRLISTNAYLHDHTYSATRSGRRVIKLDYKDTVLAVVGQRYQ